MNEEYLNAMIGEEEYLKAKAKREEEHKLKEEKEFKEFLIKREISELTKDQHVLSNVYIHNLYGVRADIEFYDEFRQDGATKEQLLNLLELFPSREAYLIKDSCTSLRPIREKEDNTTQINDYVFKYESFDGDGFISWYSDLLGECVHIKVKMSRSLSYSLFNVTYDTHLRKGYTSIDNVRIHLKDFLSGWNTLRWATGSNDHPNDFTIYHKDLNINVIEKLQGVEE